jgi:hypothetical protein
MATATVTPKAKNGKARKAVPLPDLQRMVYQGYCIAVGFDRSVAKAHKMLEAAQAKDKDGTYRWHLYLITPSLYRFSSPPLRNGCRLKTGI